MQPLKLPIIDLNVMTRPSGTKVIPKLVALSLDRTTEHVEFVAGKYLASVSAKVVEQRVYSKPVRASTTSLADSERFDQSMLGVSAE